jgi:hypothetical protein
MNKDLENHYELVLTKGQAYVKNAKERHDVMHAYQSILRMKLVHIMDC